MRNKRFFTKTTAIALSAMMMAGCAGTSTTTPTSEAIRIESTADATASTSETEESSAFEQESEDISTEEKTTLYEETEEPSSEDESLTSEEIEDTSEEESESAETEDATTLSEESESVTEEPTAEESEEETTPVPTTTVEPTTPVPTTVEPTTERQTTVAPTEPTTPEPTTAEPTTPEETTPAPETKPAVKAVKVEGSVNGTHYVGDTLGASDFTIKVTMSDGTVLTNPNGFAVSPLSITQKDMTFACAYADVSSTFTYTAQEKTTPSNPQPSVTGATATTSSIGLTRDDVGQKRMDIVCNAINLIGTPYVLGGTSTSGFDCSGFVWYVYKQAGIDIPRNAKEQANYGYKVDCQHSKEGDIFVYEYKDGTYHTGIMIGWDVGIDAMENLGVMRRETMRTDFYRAGGYSKLKAYYCIRVPEFSNLRDGKTDYTFGSANGVLTSSISIDAIEKGLYYTYVTLNGMDIEEFNSWVSDITSDATYKYNNEYYEMNTDYNTWLKGCLTPKYYTGGCIINYPNDYKTPSDCWIEEGYTIITTWKNEFAGIEFPADYDKFNW